MSNKVKNKKAYKALIGKLVNSRFLNFKLLICAVVVGAITGTVCTVFDIVPSYINEQRITLLTSIDNSVLKFILAFIFSFILGAIAIYFTKKYAPEAGGSGIPEIEGALIGLRPVRYWRVLPVKFFGGILSLSSGMVLGREGPSIQLGGNLGAFIAKIFKSSNFDANTLLASGAAAGLASAFNAPLAGVLFVLEELRPQFKFSSTSIQAVTITVICAVIARDLISGTDPVFTLPHFAMVDIVDLIYFLLFGVVIGVLGVLFNKGVNFGQDFYQRLHQGKLSRVVPLIGFVAGCFGIISIVVPMLSSSGMTFISSWVITDLSLSILLLLLIGRIFAIFLCFCSGIPGGIFAPSLSIGALSGSVIGTLLLQLNLINFDPGILAIVGMGTFFAASVRAPVTGIILVCEMTGNFYFILPMLISVGTSYFVSGVLKGTPIYTQILERTLRLSKDEEAISSFNEFKEKNEI